MRKSKHMQMCYKSQDSIAARGSLLQIQVCWFADYVCLWCLTWHTTVATRHYAVLQHMRNVIARCLQKDPALRPSATELLQDKFFKVQSHSGSLDCLALCLFEMKHNNSRMCATAAMPASLSCMQIAFPCLTPSCMLQHHV